MVERASNTASVDPRPVMRFKVIADADPSALICILQRLRRGNLAPRSVWAHRRGGGFIEIKIELEGLSDEVFRRLVDEVNEMPMIVAAVPFDIDWAHTATCA